MLFWPVLDTPWCVPEANLGGLIGSFPFVDDRLMV